MILTKLSKSHLDIAGRAIASSSKTVCCQRVAAARRYSARAEGQGSGRESAWDDQLSFLMDTESKPPSQGTSSSGQSTGGPWWDNLLSDMSPDGDPFGSKSNRRPRLRNNNRPPRRVSMTVKERQVLDSMFDDIFNVSNGKVLPPQDGPAEASGSTVDDRSSRFNQILNSARRRDRKHVMNAQQELDTMTEAIDRAMTDLELLQWAERHVFAVSIEYAEAANNAIRAALAGGASVRKSVDMLPPLQAPAYAEVLARLMRAFREKWRDPHLALAVFEHARTLSVYSYTYGCTTPAYNELLETRWTCFRDLVGFKLAVDEMNANGIRPDSRTLDIWERVRREAGFSVESQSVRELIAQIDLAISPSRKARLSKSALRDPWGPQKVAKAGAAGRNRWRDPEVQKAGGLEFGDWGESDEKSVREEDGGVEAEASPPLEEESEEDLAKAERRLESSLL